MTAANVIAEFDKNTREKVRVTLTEYNGIPLIDVRAFYIDGTEWKPGKGLSLRRELLPQLKKALQAAEKALKEEKPE
jgi:Transcriptional Coactivator p15 (PC4)